MNAQPARADLSPQLRELFAKSQTLPDAVRDALEATLSIALPNATSERVLADTFARLGYLPEEAKLATLRVLAMPIASHKPLDL